MPVRDDLLKPIPGASPGGANLRYDPLYDKIKEARREDDDVPQGDWARARKVADWPAVAKLAGDALATKSKDLQIAAWLTEALLRQDGLAGLRVGLGLLKDLVDQFWDSLYPELEDGDAELRAAPLDWVGRYLQAGVRAAPLDKAGHDFFKYKEARSIPTEAEAGADEKKAAQRAGAIEDKKLTPEEFDKAFTATPKAWYKQLAIDATGCVEALTALDEAAQAKFGDAAPSYGDLRKALGEAGEAVNELLAKKLQLEPDPVHERPGGRGRRPDCGQRGRDRRRHHGRARQPRRRGRPDRQRGAVSPTRRFPKPRAVPAASRIPLG